MINALIVDDEKLGRDTISGLLKKYCKNVNILGECDNIGSAKKIIEEQQPELLFLDIAMPGGGGFELLKSLGDFKFDVIFVTAHEEYILRALRYSAVDYLLKPIDEDELMAAVEQAERRKNEKYQKNNIKNLIKEYFSGTPNAMNNICIPTSRGFQVIKLEDIVCCEANNTYTIIYMANNDQVLSTKPLADYDLTLSDSGFVRVHKSWLVNLKHVKEYRRGEGGVVILTGDKAVDVSRRKKEFFLNELKKVFKS